MSRRSPGGSSTSTSAPKPLEPLLANPDLYLDTRPPLLHAAPQRLPQRLQVQLRGPVGGPALDGRLDAERLRALGVEAGPASRRSAPCTAWATARTRRTSAA